MKKNICAIGLTVFLMCFCSFVYSQNTSDIVYNPSLQMPQRPAEAMNGFWNGALYYKIYPTPKKMVNPESLTEAVKWNGYFVKNAKRKVNIVAEQGIDEVTIARAEQILSERGFKYEFSDSYKKKHFNILLGICGSGGVVDKMADTLKLDKFYIEMGKHEKMGTYDNHILCLTSDQVLEEKVSGVENPAKFERPAQVLILGINTDAVFYGLATLEQIMDHYFHPAVTIYDWADVKHRGVIEGYYGVPYSAAVTKDLFRFMARYKLNTYMYGAKSDPYHSRYWSEPYPTSITAEQERVGYLTQDMMKEIAETARQCKVDFIWAIHPGKAFAEGKDKDIIPHIMKKFESMYSLGIRQFGVFVDDVGVSSDPKILKQCADNLTLLQQTMDKRWNKPGTAPADTVKPLHYVPQLYAYSWVDEDQAKAFFQSLTPVPEKVNIYITGANVWSVPNNYDLAKVKSWLGRSTSWWWNYLCNDADMTKLFIADAYTNFRDETHIYSTSTLEQYLTGANTLIVNPMQQGELSKIGLFSTADYSWNTAAFNSIRSWEAALPAVVGTERSEDLKKIIPALRYYDFDQFEYLVSRYKQSVEKGKPAPGALLGELKKLNASCQVIKKMKDSDNESDRLFYNDIRPWLLKLEAMTEEAAGLLEGKNPVQRDYVNDPDFRFEILGGMGEHIKMAERTAEPSAKCLMPFIQWLREQASK